jgi:metal-responsive CopG/Arc/MetJ family transcriptional regulator
MTGRGRPSTGTRVDIRIPTELLEQIDTDAKTVGHSRAEQIRQIIAFNYSKDQP